MSVETPDFVMHMAEQEGSSEKGKLFDLKKAKEAKDKILDSIPEKWPVSVKSVAAITLAAVEVEVLHRLGKGDKKGAGKFVEIGNRAEKYYAGLTVVEGYLGERKKERATKNQEKPESES